MRVVLNGEEREIPDGLTIARLIEYLGVNPERVAVERNREVVPRAQWTSVEIRDGDRLEIVHFVGGGS
ncbi:MAG: sulfur carrier protein ThiS [Blastocatellia bacterium]|nr:sulfur carrier protein ThiS [Blastocatellia bacterium]MCS7157805.1 sulfur carrier protein ThiS [Blastocatellia bacterium]MCX7753318.1 sulfur carrier protein ThiS [Blastocatellia bacterium]MDW8168119.1 sulfur carrier protein ThiS [Acidobacteriota bacterium]MDW8257633.1 sulfur carrier protein ThiS [Acidobacteriota bacterium]